MPKNIFSVLAFILLIAQTSPFENALFALELSEVRTAPSKNNQAPMLQALQAPRLMVKPKPQKIVVSIKPYALIFESIKREGDTVSILIEDGVTSHDFQLRPSHLRKIAQADLVVWGGETLEPMLAKALKNKKQQLRLNEIKTLELIEVANQDEQSDHIHDKNIDPHIWLSKKNVQEIAKTMAEGLYYPDKATDQLTTQFLMIDTLESLKKPSTQSSTSNEDNDNNDNKNSNSVLMVYHNAYSYLEKDLNIQHSFVINESHNSKPSLRHWNMFKEQLQEYKIQNKNICIVNLPGFEQGSEAKKLHKMLKDKQMEKQTRFVEIDPLASSADYKNYFDFWSDTRKRLLACMAK
jgi:zinc transport system substrate-binding protein